VFDVFKSGQFFPYVITVCDESEVAQCPIFPGVTTRLHWSFPDPSKPGTVRFKIILANFVEKRFGHLAAGAIVNTDKENFLFHRLLREL